jgi:hypothetical protein
MKRDDKCPLGATLLQLLQASVDAESTSVRTLSNELNRPAATAATQLKLICELMGVASAQAAVARALELGWIKPRPEESSGPAGDP